MCVMERHYAKRIMIQVVEINMKRRNKVKSIFVCGKKRFILIEIGRDLKYKLKENRV